MALPKRVCPIYLNAWNESISHEVVITMIDSSLVDFKRGMLKIEAPSSLPLFFAENVGINWSGTATSAAVAVRR